MTAPNDDDDPFTHDAGELRPAATETFAEWEPGTFLENLAAAPDGSWLVTIPSHSRIDRVDHDGRHEPFAAVEHFPTGIVIDGEGAFVLTGSIGEANWRLVRVSPGGRVTPVCDLPDLRFGNGMERAGDLLYANDSALGLVLAIDPATGGSRPLLRHEWLAGPDSDRPMPGANGMSVHNGWVYVSNTCRALVVRWPADSGNPADQLEIVAERLSADDFAVHPDGRIYFATHYGNSVLRVDPGGSRTDIAGPEQGATGSTAVAVDPHDPQTLFVTTTGGMIGLDNPDAEPARLLRLRLTPQ
ncbi:hypothetical protein AB0L41_23190 [Amycolatopsis mediterranei]|uniref:SMP-30/gluconolactonase/LRE family protein n=1 Tax=Amycolatopsis mediterranei TaxID=33910 RepID=UPI00342253D3